MKVAHQQLQVFLVFGKSGWIGGLVGELLKKQGANFHWATARLEDRAALLEEIDRVGGCPAAGTSAQKLACVEISCPETPAPSAGEAHARHVRSGRHRPAQCGLVRNPQGATPRGVHFARFPASTRLPLTAAGFIVSQLETIRANVIGTLTLADVCNQRGIHLTNFATGCIFHYDDNFPQASGWMRETKPEHFLYISVSLCYARLCIVQNIVDYKSHVPSASNFKLLIQFMC